MKHSVLIIATLLLASHANAQCRLFHKKTKQEPPKLAYQLDSIYQSRNNAQATYLPYEKEREDNEYSASNYTGSRLNTNYGKSTSTTTSNHLQPPTYKAECSPKHVNTLPTAPKGKHNHIDDIISRHLAGDDVSNLQVAPFEVYFETGSHALDLTSQCRLNELSYIMRLRPNLTVCVSGFTDNVGSEDPNQSLSERRAASVVDHLMSRGIDGRRITTAAFGQNHPATTNDTEDGRQRNRRTWIIVE